MKIAVIDVDSTLWDFDKVLCSKLREKFPHLDDPDKWGKWEFYQDYGISKKEFYKVVDEIHREQEEYEPFSCASQFLKTIKKDYYVVIASHRKLKNRQYLVNWLLKNNIEADTVWVGDCKYHFFDDASLVVDDSPVFMLEAFRRNSGFICGIKYSWNEELKDDFLLADSLEDLMKQLKELKIIAT